jgi:hypothetical protein
MTRAGAVMTGNASELTGGFGAASDRAGGHCLADFDGDVDMNTADLLPLLGNWG